MADQDTTAYKEKPTSISSAGSTEPASRFFRKRSSELANETSVGDNVDAKPAKDVIPPVSFTQMFRSVQPHIVIF